MTTTTTSVTPPRSTSILARAKRLGTTTLLVAVPFAIQPEATASTMTLDYSTVGQSTSSGWFVGVPDENKADGNIINNGFKLWGSDTLTDSMFWVYNDYYQQLQPRYDFTGTSFIWGGRITGGTTSEDTLSAPFDFSITFTNGAINSYTSVSSSLRIGYSRDPYQGAEQYQSVRPYNIENSAESYRYYDSAGNYHETGNLSVNLTDTNDDLYWFAMLSVDWNNEFQAGWYWNGSYQTLNGDTMTVTIPQNSIDVTYTSANSVPDGGSTAAMLGLTLLCLALVSRRR